MLNKAAELCECPVSWILEDSKINAAIDARYLVVQYMRRLGYSNDDVALAVYLARGQELEPKEIRSKAKYVCKIFRDYSERCNNNKQFIKTSQQMAEYCHEAFDLMCLRHKQA